MSVHGLGGLTMSRGGRELSDWDEIVISLAGPAAGVVIGLAALALQDGTFGDSSLAITVALRDLVWVNLAWGLVNLVPVLPLDGGVVMERLVRRAAPGRADLLPPLISMGVAIPLALWAWFEGYGLAAVLAAFFVAMNFRSLTDARDDRRRATHLAAADQALGLLRSADPAAAIDAIEAALADGPPRDVADRLAVGLAWARSWRAGAGDAERVAQLVGEVHGRQDTALLSAWTAQAARREPETFAFLVRGFAHEQTEPPTWYLDRLVPDRAAVEHLTAWIAQLDLEPRHTGLSRLASSLERAGRRADADAVRGVMARPIG